MNTLLFDILSRLFVSLKKATYGVEAAFGVIGWILGMFNQVLAQKFSDWDGFDPKWAWLPLGLVFGHLFLRAMYDHFRELEIKHLGYSSSIYDSRRDWKRTIRAFTFASLDGGLPTRWAHASPLHCKTDIVDTKNEPIEETSALSLTLDGVHSGIRKTFDPLTVDYIEFVGQFPDDSVLAVYIRASGLEDNSPLKLTLSVSLNNEIRPVQIKDTHWRIPAEPKALGNNWISLMCNVRSGFNRSFGRQGYRMLGVTDIVVMSANVKLARIEIYQSWWRSKISR